MLVPAQRQLLAAGLVHCRTLDEAPVDALRSLLGRDSFACVRGLVDPAEVARGQQVWRARFDAARDCRPDPSRPDFVRRNVQCLFDRPSAQAGRQQFARAFYNPLWDEDIYRLHDVFRTVARLRNRIMGLPIDFAIDGPAQGLWTASRLHHYPRGLGFMVPHKDNTFASLPGELGLYAYVQITIVLSRRGTDYERGGAYFVHDGARVYFEEEYEIGDLVLYDERAVHGVEVVDDHLPPDRDSSAGRLAAFANLYRWL